MVQLEHARIAKQLFEVRGRVVVASELNEMRAAVAGGKLHEAQPVAGRHQAECFGIHRDGRAEVQSRRQIIFVQSDFHWTEYTRDGYRFVNSAGRSACRAVARHGSKPGAQKRTRTSTPCGTST